ncbi:MAG: MraY family glycosyltransferase, partial [Acidobacteriia bacterium]|nr:MraY family glycosyltransferase [Terriglobia bacterium]
GGVALYLSMLVALALVTLLSTIPALHFRSDYRRVLVEMGLAGLVLLIGLWDDVRTLSVWQKFALQTLVGLLCWFLGYRILVGWAWGGNLHSWGLLSLPLTLVWIVGLTNAFNLIDGIDGLSSGAALFATISLLVVSVVGNQTTTVVILAALAGATLGFLRYNFNPASIFLGDSGSLLLGFLLALLSLESSQKSTAAFAIAVPLVAFGLPVLDTVVVMLRRFLSGHSLFEGDRRHIHHLLIERGFSPRKAVILLYGVCGLFGLFALLFLNPMGGSTGFALAILGVCVWFAIQQLHYPELRELNSHFARGIQNQRKLIAGSVAVGRLMDGIRASKNFAELLNTLSGALAEMEFSRAEFRLPHIGKCLEAPKVANWTVIPDGEDHCLFQWWSTAPSASSTRADQETAQEQFKLADHFKVEFGFEFGDSGIRAVDTSRGPGTELEGRHVGRVTFYHSSEADYPVSAISLLSRTVWKELGYAMERFVAQQPRPATASPQIAFKQAQSMTGGS